MLPVLDAFFSHGKQDHIQKSLHMLQRRSSQRDESLKEEEIISGWEISILPFSGHVLNHIKPMYLSIIGGWKELGKPNLLTFTKDCI